MRLGKVPPWLAARAGKGWGTAVPTACPKGHKHASRTEAGVCARLHLEYAQALRAGTVRILQQVRFPLMASAGDEAGRPLYQSVDFAVVGQARAYPTGTETWLVARLVDAKGNRKSREWERGVRALEATIGVRVEECAR